MRTKMIWFLSLLFVAARLSPSNEAAVQCDRGLDLAFILDSSTGISGGNFSQAKNFIQQMCGLFRVAPRGTRVALTIYSHNAHVVSKFGDITNREELVARLGELPRLEGGNRLDLALLAASARLFTANDGMRREASVAKVAIVITHGRQAKVPDAVRLDEAVARLLYHGVKVLAIGVGDAVDPWELGLIVADPTTQTFRAATYGALRTQYARIAQEACDTRVFTGEDV